MPPFLLKNIFSVNFAYLPKFIYAIVILIKFLKIKFSITKENKLVFSKIIK